MWKHLAFVSILVFTLGWLSNEAMDSMTNTVQATPYEPPGTAEEHQDNAGPVSSPDPVPAFPETVFVGEKPSPHDWVSQFDIHVERNRFWVAAPQGYELQWNVLADTNSMDPLLDESANAIQIVPQDARDIHIGDVISYETEFGIIIHRVVNIGQDENGWYAITRGDNVPIADPVRVRFSQIRRVLIAIVY